MTRPTLRHTLSALAALALVSAFTSCPASAQPVDQWFTNQMIRETEEKKPKTPKGLATKKGQQAPYVHPVDPEGSTRLKINTPAGE